MSIDISVRACVRICLCACVHECMGGSLAHHILSTIDVMFIYIKVYVYDI